MSKTKTVLKVWMSLTLRRQRLVVCFFQAEDGIRDYKVTGVQTCALPISVHVLDADGRVLRYAANSGAGWQGLPEEFPATAGLPGLVVATRRPVLVIDPVSDQRSEERRVGKEGRSRWSPDHYKKKKRRESN